MSGIDELERMRKRKASKPPSANSRESLRALDKEQVIDLALELCSEVIDLNALLFKICDVLVEWEERG